MNDFETVRYALSALLARFEGDVDRADWALNAIEAENQRLRAALEHISHGRVTEGSDAWIARRALGKP